MNFLRWSNLHVYRYIMFDVSAYFYQQKETVCILQKYAELLTRHWFGRRAVFWTTAKQCTYFAIFFLSSLTYADPLF